MHSSVCIWLILLRIVLLNEFVVFYAVIILLPNIFGLVAPAACQIRADKNISFALITSCKMTSADIEHSDFVTEHAFDISEKIANYEVSCCCHFVTVYQGR
jgi:hypothetical protein